MNDWRKPCEHGKYDTHATFEGRAVSWASANELAITGEVETCPGGSPVTAADLEGEKVWWCLAHEAPEWDDRHEFCLLRPGLDESDAVPCRMVERLLIPIPESQETNA